MDVKFLREVIKQAFHYEIIEITKKDLISI